MTYLSSLQTDGYVLIPSLLSPSQLASLVPTATNTATLARSGAWPHFRTVPKQFPPWPKDPPSASEGGIWGVQHLLHPEMPGRAEYAKVYFDERVLGVVEELLSLKPGGAAAAAAADGGGGDEEALVMELFNMLVAPETRDFELRWHRDDIPNTATPSEEAELLHAKSPEGRQSHAQYNLALCSDASLIVVPGSHRRVRTETERAADPYEPYIPGQKVVELKPGDAVFYDSNILHRGVYHGKKEGDEETRLTLHGSVGLKQREGQEQGQHGKVRATAVLQHGVGAWVNREEAAFGLGERAERMRRNLVDMGTGEGVGYSLQG